MAKNLAHLKLVTAEEGQNALAFRPSSGFDFFTVEELSQPERNQVQRLVAAVAPRSGIVAVTRTVREWDLRPVVALAGEDGPSIIRRLPLSVSNSEQTMRFLRQSYERLSRYEVLSSQLRDWGVYEGQFWFRRTLVQGTLAHDISSDFSLSANDLIVFTRRLVSLLAHFHSHGVFHGHVSTANIYYASETLSLLDVGAAYAMLCCEPSAFDGENYTFAPELRDTTELQAAADCFSCGQILKRLLFKVGQRMQWQDDKAQFDYLHQRLSVIAGQMVDLDARRRPPLGAVLSVIEEIESDLNGGMRTHPSGKISHQREVPVRRIASPLPQEIVAQHESVVFKGSSQPLLPQHSEGLVTSDGELELHSMLVTKRNSSWWVYVIGAASLSFSVYLLWQKYYGDSIEYAPEDLRLAWESSIPSRMGEVANLALELAGSKNYAEELILKSVFNGSRLPSGVNAVLLRVAFDERWERQLSAEDRRLAFALGLAGIVDKGAMAQLGPLEQHHPGIILALVASAGENAAQILKKVPLTVLTDSRLGNLGKAFAELTAENKTCAADDVRVLARYIVDRPVAAAELKTVMGSSTGFLRALSLVFANEPNRAEELLAVLFTHPNVQFAGPEILWARVCRLLEWQDLEPSDKLSLLAGVVPQGAFSSERVAMLFGHPDPEVRSYAAQQAIDRITFQHQSSVSVLQFIAQHPEILTGEQLVQLAQFLAEPAKGSKESIKAWLEKKPPLALLEIIVMAMVGKNESTSFDELLAVYLRTQGWSPKAEQIELLVNHPVSYLRLFAYNTIFNEREGTRSKDVLNQALEKEVDPALRKLIEEMLGVS